MEALVLLEKKDVPQHLSTIPSIETCVTLMEALTREFQDAGQPSFRIWGEGKELLVFKMDGPPTQKDKKPKRRRTSMGNLGKSFGAHLSIAKFKESETLALAWRHGTLQHIETVMTHVQN